MSGTPARYELWVKAAIGLVLAFAIGTIYLGTRPGGLGPILVFTWGPIALGVPALLLFLFGGVWTLTHRPLARRGRLLGFSALAVLITVVSYPMPYPSSHEGRPSAVRFELPVEGEWTVRWGGEAGRNPLAFLPDRRWGLDLVRDDAFGAAVLAPAAGEVVRVVDGLPDEGARDPYGNHLVLCVTEGEYVVLSSLRSGSIAVAEGERVELGARLAEVGTSGASPMTPTAHLSLHLQDGPEPGRAEAVPWRFHGYLADGEPVEAGLPVGTFDPARGFVGQRVRRAP